MFLFSGAKIRCFLLPRAGFPLKGWGKIPTSLFRGCAVLYIIRYRTGVERKGLREVFRCFWNNQTKYLLPLHSEKNNLMNRLEFKTESKNNKRQNKQIMKELKALNKRTAPKSVAPEKIIQFGEGNFLRAFVDWIVWNMNKKTDFNGSVVVVQPLAGGMVDWLNGQDCLYHVNLQGKENGQAINTLERIDVISRALNPYSQNQAFMALAEQPEMRFIISNTTEAGIAFDDSCKFTDAPAASYPGKLVQLLFHRYKFFEGDPTKGMILMPCELIFLNGHHLKECIYQYIELWKGDMGADYEGFKEWFTNHCYVCATLVDRIVPGFPRDTIKEIQQKVCYKDNLVVKAESFHLWVIEKAENMTVEQMQEEFPAHKAGLHVLITDNEKPYHERKVTLLNGPHTVLSPVTYLSGVNIVRDACEHPVLGKYIHKVQFEELMQTLNLPMDELQKFASDVLERFENPFVDHQVTSIMLNSFPKFETRDLPGVKIYLERKGELPQGLVFGLAAIITYYKGGVREDGAPIQPNDDQKIMDKLTELWATGDTQKVAEGVLGFDYIWHEDLNKTVPGLTELVKKDLDLIQEKGMLEAVKTIL
jgi:tagaturonate reductase